MYPQNNGLVLTLQYSYHADIQSPIIWIDKISCYSRVPGVGGLANLGIYSLVAQKNVLQLNEK